MKRESPRSEFNKIDRSVVDAILYGITRGLAFLGKDNRGILDEMGNNMLEYLIKIGKIEYHNDPEEFGKSLGRLLASNGFSMDVPLEFKGSPRTPSAPHFIDYLKRAEADGDREIDWDLVEMVTYGMTKGLDSIGAQGQILINRIGWEMINYLADNGKVVRSDDPMEFINSVGDYFMKIGFAKEIELNYEGANFDTMVITYTHSRYHMNVLSRLRDEGSLLYSCPPCVAATSIMRMTRGVRAQFDVESAPIRGEKITLRHKIYYDGDRFTDEKAREVSRLMESGA